MSLVDPERAESKAHGMALRSPRRDLGQWEGLQPPEVEADVADVVAAAAGDGADLRRVGGRLEGAAQQLQHGDRAFGPPVAKRVGDESPIARRDGGNRIQVVHRQQVADVGRQPGLACLYEPVVVEPKNVRVYCIGLFGDDRQQSLQGPGLIGDAEPCVPVSVDLGQQVEQVGRSVDHFCSWMSMPAGLTVSSCAAFTTEFSRRAGNADRIGLGSTCAPVMFRPTSLTPCTPGTNCKAAMTSPSVTGVVNPRASKAKPLAMAAMAAARTRAHS